MLNSDRERILKPLAQSAAAAGVIFLVLAVVFNFGSEFLLAWGKQFYVEGDLWRFPYFAERVAGFRVFVPVAATACFLWAAVLMIARRSPIPSLSTLLSTVLACTAWLAAVIVSFYFSRFDWVHYGRPCWDGYCTYAQLLHTCLFARGPSTTADLLDFMRSDFHSNSPLVPLVVALFMKIEPKVMDAYRVSSGAATIATFFVLWHVLRRSSYDREVSWVALFLLWTNMAVARSFIFPQTDAFAMLWGALLIHFALKRLQDPRPVNDIPLALVLISGLFVKLSLLPILGLAPVWFLLARRLRAKGTLVSWMSLQEVVLLTLIPGVIYLLFQRAIGTTALYKVELVQIVQRDSFAPFVVVSFFLTCGIFLYLTVLSRPIWTGADVFIVAWIGIYLAGLWLSRAAGWNRFYLPVLPAFAVIAAKGLDRIRREAAPGALWFFAGGSAVLHYLGLWLRVH